MTFAKAAFAAFTQACSHMSAALAHHTSTRTCLWGDCLWHTCVRVRSRTCQWHR